MKSYATKRSTHQKYPADHHYPGDGKKSSPRRDKTLYLTGSSPEKRLWKKTAPDVSLLRGRRARRFARLHRNDLWQMDLKYLLVLPETAQHKAQQLYASVIIDDATRLVVNCKICERRDTWNVLDSFRQALELYGIPERIYNGPRKLDRVIRCI